MGAFLLQLDEGVGPLRVAVKDLIDMAALPTTAGCRVLARHARAATADAACMAGVRAAVQAGTARLVGKTGLNELAFGVTGLNPFFASPVNPLDPHRVVGGSSSGSAAAVGAGEADVAIGSDTGGSIRIPAACCGVAGLKTTAGRVALDGVWPLAPSLDTVGPLARDVAGLVAGMALLEPGFSVEGAPTAAVVGRVRLAATPSIDGAIDAALAACGLPVVEAKVAGWSDAVAAGMTVLGAEAWATDRGLYETGGLSPEVAERLVLGAGVTPAQLASARHAGKAWQSEVASLVAGLAGAPDRPAVLAMPTLADLPPLVSDARRVTEIRHTMPWNLAGWPALALPVPVPGGGLPASLQLVAPPGGEALLLATASRLEASVAV